MRIREYAVYRIVGAKIVRLDRQLYTWDLAREKVKELNANGEKAFFTRVR